MSSSSPTSCPATSHSSISLNDGLQAPKVPLDSEPCNSFVELLIYFEGNHYVEHIDHWDDQYCIWITISSNTLHSKEDSSSNYSGTYNMQPPFTTRNQIRRTGLRQSQVSNILRAAGSESAKTKPWGLG